MGLFSFVACDTGNRIKVGTYKEYYLLIPKHLQNQYDSYIKETRYDGYGDWGGYNIFVLLAEFNKGNASKIIPLMEKPKLEHYGGLYSFEKDDLRKQGLSEQEIKDREESQRKEYYKMGLQRFNYSIKNLKKFDNGLINDEDVLESIGIDLFEFNDKLDYPLKIVERSDKKYESVASCSDYDPLQGCD